MNLKLSNDGSSLHSFINHVKDLLESKLFIVLINQSACYFMLNILLTLNFHIIKEVNMENFNKISSTSTLWKGIRKQICYILIFRSKYELSNVVDDK